MSRIRLKNGNTVYIPENMSERDAAQVLFTAGCRVGYPFLFRGRARQLAFRGGMPALVPHTPNPVVML